MIGWGGKRDITLSSVEYVERETLLIQYFLYSCFDSDEQPAVAPLHVTQNNT